MDQINLIRILSNCPFHSTSLIGDATVLIGRQCSSSFLLLMSRIHNSSLFHGCANVAYTLLHHHKIMCFNQINKIYNVL